MTADLRSLIEGKARRTEAFPILVGDASAAASAVQQHRAALAVLQQEIAARTSDGAAPTDGDAARIEGARQALSDALERQAATVVTVELQSLEPDVWDAVVDPLPEDEEGSYDLDPVRAELTAASCVDESLRDPAWWQAQLDSPAWSKGDKIALNHVLVRLNLNVPTGSAGKG